MPLQWHLCIYRLSVKGIVKVWKKSSWKKGKAVLEEEDTTLETQAGRASKCSSRGTRTVHGICGSAREGIYHIYVIYTCVDHVHTHTHKHPHSFFFKDIASFPKSNTQEQTNRIQKLKYESPLCPALMKHTRSLGPGL